MEDTATMLVTASWGGADVAVEVDAECRSVDGLKRCLQEALPEVDAEAVRLEVCGRPVDDEAVLGLVDGSVIEVSASQAALAAATLREEGCAVDFSGFCDAAEKGDVRRCKLYLDVGVAWPRRVGTNPLHVALLRRNGELCELLLNAGCATDRRNRFGLTALDVALDQGNCELCKLLLDAGCDTHTRDGWGTPLHRAVRSPTNSYRLCKLLLDAGCEKSSKNSISLTPLAMTHRDPELRRLLLSAGCK